MSEETKERRSFVQSIKVIVSGACAVVIGLAWKDYILQEINSIAPLLQSKFKLNPHIISFLFIALLTIILSLVIHKLSN